MRTYFSIGMVLLISACGGNVKQDLVCNEGSSIKAWHQLGYDTAVQGKNIRTFDALKARCSTVMSREIRTAFIDGYTQGALDFCTYEKGYALGFDNFDMPSVCPYEIRAEFLKGYKDGNLAYDDKIKRFEKAQDDFTESSERAKRFNDSHGSSDRPNQ
ncbi:DUF2799 domain-containing protein [Teredinibacter turnerae]|uniref:DUF2799 domain-containing protein n=1 Tax=Teredinibacter turnerae TaxID=2426 RepID=UPI00042A002D|nr:DUF2799 domain-containing protein [Teredinibacter turnerae]